MKVYESAGPDSDTFRGHISNASLQNSVCNITRNVRDFDTSSTHIWGLAQAHELPACDSIFTVWSREKWSHYWDYFLTRERTGN